MKYFYKKITEGLAKEIFVYLQSAYGKYHYDQQINLR